MACTTSFLVHFYLCLGIGSRSDAAKHIPWQSEIMLLLLLLELKRHRTHHMGGTSTGKMRRRVSFAAMLRI